MWIVHTKKKAIKSPSRPKIRGWEYTAYSTVLPFEESRPSNPVPPPPYPSSKSKTCRPKKKPKTNKWEAASQMNCIRTVQKASQHGRK